MFFANGRKYYYGDGIGDIFKSILNKDLAMDLTKSVVSGASNAFAQNIGKKGGEKLAEKVNAIKNTYNKLADDEALLNKVNNLTPNLSELYGRGLRTLK